MLLSPAAFHRLVCASLLWLSCEWGLGQPQTSSVKVDCSAAMQKMRTDFAIDPGRLVLALEDALTMNEVCACPLVRTAVDLAGHDPVLCSNLLLAAINLLPHATAEITECVLLEAPEAGPAIRASLARELGEKTPGLFDNTVVNGAGSPPPVVQDGKSSIGKQPIPVALTQSPPEAAVDSEGEVNFPINIGASGIYFLSTPRAEHSPMPQIREHVGFRPTFTTKTPPRRPVLPATRSTPD